MSPKEQHAVSPSTSWEDVPEPPRQAHNPDRRPKRPATGLSSVNPSHRQKTTKAQDNTFSVDSRLISGVAADTVNSVIVLLGWFFELLLQLVSLLVFFVLVISIIWFYGQGILQGLARKLILTSVTFGHRIRVLGKVYGLSLSDAFFIASWEAITGIHRWDYPIEPVTEWFYYALQDQPWW